jgi:hypothetical protein
VSQRKYTQFNQFLQERDAIVATLYGAIDRLKAITAPFDIASNSWMFSRPCTFEVDLTAFRREWRTILEAYQAGIHTPERRRVELWRRHVVNGEPIVLLAQDFGVSPSLLHRDIYRLIQEQVTDQDNQLGMYVITRQLGVGPHGYGVGAVTDQPGVFTAIVSDLANAHQAYLAIQDLRAAPNCHKRKKPTRR